MKLTQRYIDSLTAPTSKTEVIVFDDLIRGLGFRVRKNGTRSWIVQRRDQTGQSHRVTIDQGGTLPLEHARNEAREHIAWITLGRDITKERKFTKEQAKHSKAETLGAVVEIYLQEQERRVSEGRFSRRTLTEVKRYLLCSWQPLHKTPIAAITRRQIVDQLDKLMSHRAAADQARNKLSAFFAWAMRKGLAEENPVIRTERPDISAPRERVLLHDEIQKIWNALENDTYGRVVKLLLLTGARRQEIGGMAWSELDRAANTWTLPKERAKNKRALTLPLPPLAWEILDSQPHLGPFVFTGRSQGFQHFARPKALLDKRAQIAPWYLHDIRRTVVTELNELGVNPWIVEAIVNHVGAKAGVAGTYNKARYLGEVKQALESWEGRLRQIVGLDPRPSSEIIEFKRA